MKIEETFDYLKKLLSIKKEKLIAINDIKGLQKVECLENLFNNQRCFLNLQYDVSINILKFLEIEDNKILSTYKTLISPELFNCKIVFKNK